MATQKNVKQSARQGSNNSGSNNSFYIPPPDVPNNKTDDDSQTGFLIAFISMVIVFGLLLPLIAWMYLDILQTKNETKQQQEVILRLINQYKQEKEYK